MTAFKVGDRVTLKVKDPDLLAIVGIVEDVQVSYIVKWPSEVKTYPAAFYAEALEPAPERRSGRDRRVLKGREGC